MTRNELIQYLADLEEVMDRTANRADIWQDRCIYVMAKALRGLVLERLKDYGGHNGANTV